MTSEPKINHPDVLHSWDTHWQGVGETDSWSAGGASHPSILAFWQDYFKSLARQGL